MIQGAPPDAQRDPQGYYYWLVSNGFPHNVAYDEMVKEFGPPKTKEEQEKELAKKQQQSELAQVGGVVGGTALTGWIMDGMKMPEFLKSGPKTTPTPNAPTATPSAPTPNASMPSAPTPSSAGTGASSFAKNFTPLDPGKVPAGQPVPDGMTAIQSNMDGTIQVVPTESLSDSSFMNSVNWDAVGSGAMAALSAYQAYKSYQSGDKIGAGISGASAVSLGAQAANQAGMSFAGSQSMAAAAPYLGAAAGVYQGYQTAKMIGDTAAGSQRTKQGALGGAASGAMIGGAVGGPIGLAIGAAVGGLAGAVGSWTGSKKGKAQFMRDNIRGVLQEGGVLDDKYQGTLADGTKYDFGKDGSTLKWKEIDKISAEKPKAWNGAVPLADELAASYGFVGQKASDIAAWYAKGAVSNAGDDAGVAQKNMQHFAKQQGITYDMVKTKLDEAMKDNLISQSQYDYYLGGARQLTSYSGKPSMGRQVPPAPRPGSTAPAPAPEAAPQENKKLSVGDVLRRNVKK
jgi:hypothetical protein